MEKISPSERLKNQIQLLKGEQAMNEQLLKGQYFIVVESLKPINLLKSTLRDVATSPYLVENIVSSSVGMATGFVTKKLFVGFSGNIIRRILGSLLQFGVTNAVASHPDAINAVGHIIQHFFSKKSTKTK